jgi:uncharacterized protein involved in exopolysaccharide biosynthesis
MSVPATAPLQPEGELTLRDLVEVLLRRRYVIVAVFVACLVGAVGASFLLPPRYRATATVVLERQHNNSPTPSQDHEPKSHRHQPKY